jgi:hypothetical protein
MRTPKTAGRCATHRVLRDRAWPSPRPPTLATQTTVHQLPLTVLRPLHPGAIEHPRYTAARSRSTHGIGTTPPFGSVAATAWACSRSDGKSALSGGRASASTTTFVVDGSVLRTTWAFGGAACRTAARTAVSCSPRAAARAPARAASTQATWAAAALTPHSATARTTTSAGKATAVSTVTEPCCPHRLARVRRARHECRVPDNTRRAEASSRARTEAKAGARSIIRPG